MSEYSSRGVGGAGLGLGIAGTALGILNGGLGNLFNMGGCNSAYNTSGCGDNALVNRYEASQNAKIADLETEVKLRDANTFTMTEMGRLRDYVDRRFEGVNAQLCTQSVLNAQTTAAISCMQGNIAALQGLTKIVIPNSNVCPGWGDVTVSVTPAPTTTTGA